MKRFLTILACIFAFCLAAQAQTIKDASYRTIGHADGIPLKWAAYYFFF